MKPKHVPSVSALARELSLSRQWCQELFKMEGHPAPTKAGHNIEKWQRWLSERTEKIGTTAGERTRLQIDMLRHKLAREQHELEVARGAIEARAYRKYAELLDHDHKILSAELRRMPTLYSPRFEGLGAREIFSMWNKALDEAFIKFRAAFSETEQVEPKPKVIIPFRDRKAATG